MKIYLKKLSNDKNKSKKIEKDEKEFKEKEKIPKSYYTLLLFMIVLAAVSLKLVILTKNNFNEEDYAVFSSLDDNSEQAENIESIDTIKKDTQDVISNNNDTSQIGKQEESSTKNEKINVIQEVQNKVEQKVVKKEEPLVFVKPLNGEITKIYSIDKLIYSKTLDMWKTHDGIDIKGELNEKVKCIERGTVLKIYDDAFYGKTVVIDHGQGYKSSYSNLSENISISVGKKVKKGEIIGYIGNTSIGEFKDQPHIHFMLYENNEIADPTSIFQ